jgi:hypothetical protein
MFPDSGAQGLHSYQLPHNNLISPDELSSSLELTVYFVYSVMQDSYEHATGARHTLPVKDDAEPGDMMAVAGALIPCTAIESKTDAVPFQETMETGNNVTRAM